MAKKILILFIFLAWNSLLAQKPTELYLKNQTPSYDQVIAFYKVLAEKYPEARLQECGKTDIGKPLHVFIISKSQDFDLLSLKKRGTSFLLINNGIHPGEPEGIEASMNLAEDLLKAAQDKKSTYLDHTVIAIIPVYNVDGALNRSCCSRVNQNGPEEYGFRGNSRNLDLNRDFIKCDSENAKSFSRLFQSLKPDVFIDTHTSDGADYQYVMTLIATQHSKLNPIVSSFVQKNMLPEIYRAMKAKGYEMTPYVDPLKRTPDDGIAGFLEIPRFSTGYSTLFNTIGFVTETHMWKPYKDRVLASIAFLKTITDFTDANHNGLRITRGRADSMVAAQQEFTLSWELDTTKFDQIEFKGYEARYKTSTISGLQRLYYDRSAPYTRIIKFFDMYAEVQKAFKPRTYIVPQAWKEVLERLDLNGVRMKRLENDTTLLVEVYYITDYKTSAKPYEGHYLHSDVKLRRENRQIRYYKGDYLVETNQAGNRYIVETLEPQAPDSYFAWNFFDSVLQQKEGFSDYIFEEKAEELLKKDPALASRLKDMKQKDSVFAKDHEAQLVFIYKNSVYYEPTHLRYPVARIMNR